MNPSALFAAQYAEAIKLRKQVDPVLKYYEDLRIAYLNNDAVAFNLSVASIQKECEQRAPSQVTKIGFEKTYNQFEPFYRSSLAYILIFVSASLSWLCVAAKKPNFNAKHADNYKNFAYYLTLITLIAHTFWSARAHVHRRTSSCDKSLFLGSFYRLGCCSALLVYRKIPAVRNCLSNGCPGWWR